ncbi:MAG TPA: AraC family transcriptional regulator [Burkholderiales bacterium]
MLLTDIPPTSSRPSVAWYQRELSAVIERYSGANGIHKTAIPGLTLIRGTQTTPGGSCGVYKPALALIAQGEKHVTLGEDSFLYDQSRYLVSSVDLPVIGRVTRASEEEPYLCFMFDLDPRRIGALMSEMSLSKPPSASGRAMAVGQLTVELLDPVLRLARLLDSPQDIAVLAPMIERELIYRLLTGELGPRLRNLAVAESQTGQISRAIDWLKTNYARPLRIEDLAKTVHMSESSLHHHFKAVTALSPLQYQKQLRLQEARRLMLTEMQDAASAGHRVGYESPSQFSREYSRLYGAPPLRDIAQLRKLALGANVRSQTPTALQQ